MVVAELIVHDASTEIRHDIETDIARKAFNPVPT
jgi:hypothetical protein